MSSKTPDEYVNDFRRCEQEFRDANGRSARAVLSLCKVVADASEGLEWQGNRHDWERFLKRVNLRSKSTVSQYRTIGVHYERLMEHVDKLPASWFTLYRIAKLDGDTLASAIATKQIHPFVTQSKVEQLLTRNTPSEKRHPLKHYGFDVRISSSSVARVTPQDCETFWKKLSLLCRGTGWGISVSITPDLARHLEMNRRDAPAAAAGASEDDAVLESQTIGEGPALMGAMTK